MTVFTYGDEGTPNVIGEGSIKMADRLGIDSDPRNGGFNDKDIHDMGKGVMHIVFPGSSDVPIAKNRTQRTTDEIDQLGKALFAQFCKQQG
jgi:hypothetical protein